MLRSVRILFLFLISVLALAQPQREAAASLVSSDNVSKAKIEPAVPVITFTLDFPASLPEHYSICVPLKGPAHYRSSGRISADSDKTDTFEFDFALSAPSREKP